MYKFTNRLIKETSPYLLQHAHNPVDWYPWGEEAFEKAREENKPVFLSIGYSSCHWCHVMEHESFENEEIASIMNEHFISIKVDREERPDIDQLYMQYVQMTTGSGGWPMSVFLTSEQKPFYGGTYFPPDDRYGRPGFRRVLETMAEFYKKDTENLAKILLQVDDAFSRENELPGAKEMPDRSDWDSALEQLTKMYEPVFGGIGHAPKFPAVNVLNLFLREFNRTKEINYLNMVTHTLKNMANGGIYDQIGGGFARYSVDEKWLVPHFEKMLYDNAQLVVLYLDTYLVTGEKFFLNVAEETLAFVQRELTSPEGGFYSSLDADSEGEEGKFYVWSTEEIEKILGKSDADIFNNYYGVTSFGNFEGKNILFVNKSMEQLASETRQSIGELSEIIKSGRTKLLNEREKRIRPALDDKVITSWDGLMLSAYARAYQITQNPEYLSVINKNIRFLKKNLYSDKILKRTYKNGQAKYNGFIEDYAILINALLDSYEAVFDPAIISWAIDLTNYANEHFRDLAKGGYYTASDQQEKLFKRMKDTSDSSIPSGTGIMLMNNLRLFSLTENAQFYEISREILKIHSNNLTVNPYGFSTYLAALDFYLEKPKEILIACKENQDISDYLNLVFGSFRPNKVVIVQSENDDLSSFTASLITGKKAIDGKTTAYVCRDFTCSLPVQSLSELQNLINN